MKDLYNAINTVSLLEATQLAHADQYSKILDRTGFEGAMIIAQIGDLTGVDTANYVTPVLQESDTTNNLDFTDVDPSKMITNFSRIDAANKDQVTMRASYGASKRYLRVKFAVTSTGGTYPTGYVNAIGVLTNARHAPSSDPSPVTAT